MNAGLSAHPVFDADILDGLHLLEADAGTGKTWTIAGLVVRALIERGLGLEQVLVVTFTNAATAELAARIRQRIAQLERLLDDRLEGRASAIAEPFCVACAARLDDAAARRARSALRVALARVDEMAVHTIHGLCQRIIDEHALSIGVPAGLPVGEQAGESERARVADWWRAHVLDAPVARLLAFGVAGLDPQRLHQAVRAIVSQPLARIEPPAHDWRQSEHELAAVRGELAAALDGEADALLQWLGVKGNANGRYFRVGWAQGWLAALRRFCTEPFPVSIPDAAAKLAASRFGQRQPPSAIPALCERLSALADALARLPGAIAQEIAIECAAARQDDLAQAQALGFDDLLRLVHDALHDPAAGAPLAEALRERYPMALVDECQDTDPLQWAIFRRVYVDAPADAAAARRSLVLVGDPKQAIYAFRGADVYAYLDARDAVRRVHRLGENQRSSPALIAAVNTLFDRERPFLVREIGFPGAGIGARARRALAIDDGPARAPMTVVRLEPDPETGSLAAAAARRQVVNACVAEIGRLLGAGARLGEAPLGPADIAVLVNTHRQGAEIKRALAAAGIGAAEVSRESVLDTLECGELVRVIAAIAEPAEPGLLRSALATTLLGESARDLQALEHDAARILLLAGRFARARDDWERHGALAAMRRLFRDEEVAARLGALRDGDRRLTNLLHLLELLGADDDANRGPQQALRALARRRAAGVGADRDSEELRLESDENLVRILTVHKSKGLEFPIVFLPFAWSSRSNGTAFPTMRHEPRPEGGWRAVLDFAPDAAALRQAATERYAETLRAMYVAVTRAEQRCYLFWGAAAGAGSSPLAWLLARIDPVAPGDSPQAQESADALDADAVDRVLGQWRERAHERDRSSLVVIDTPTLMAAGRTGGTPPARGAQPVPPGDDVGRDRAIDPAMLVVRPWHVAIPAPAITTSFSAIVSALSGAGDGAAADAHDAVERPDHDQQPVAAARPPSDATPSIRFRFPSGAQAGVCLHGILEQARFDAPVARSMVAERLMRGGYRRIDPEPVGAWLDEVVAAPLRAPQDETILLRDVPAARQVRELDFLLAGNDVSDRAVIEAVAAESGLDAGTGTSRWHGFLRGFIDLVFEHRGRYYLLDWKSNHLGDAVTDYAAAPLAAAMREHAYALQASLYTLALHRWLRRRLPGYDYERHFGGAFYVFLRGAGLDAAAGGQTGIHASRASARLVDTLDRLFGAGDRGARQ
jgi:exodeoxyribonuclease V beta subunit